jgi:hypothetical protein
MFLMSKPGAVRRIKSYSAASGFVYQYQFHDFKSGERDGVTGNEYVYYVSLDRKTMFRIRIFVRRDAIERWSERAGRSLTGAEEYAVAKMRLFQAFDETEEIRAPHPDLSVDDSNLEQLMERLNL